MEREKLNKEITALYCRLSKEDKLSGESMSISTQKEMIMDYARKNGFRNCKYYVDDGYSGTNSDREAFQEMLDDVRDGRIAVVITKDQSRLGRNYIETGTYMEIFFPEHGVRYIAINDGYDSDKDDHLGMMAPIRNIMNEMYARDTSKKIKSALHTRKMQGKYLCTTAPYGYKKDPTDSTHLIIDDEVAPVVRYIYDLAEEGLGLHSICKRLRDDKILKPCWYKKEMFERFVEDDKMYDWDNAYVSQILHSPTYAGHLAVDCKPTISMKTKKRKYIAFADREIIRNTHEAIISQEQWDRVQTIISSRSSSFNADRTEYDNIFRGLLRCADCERTMLVKVENKRIRDNVLDKTFYCCSTYRKYGKKACGAHTLEARMLHEAVLADIQRHAELAVTDREEMVRNIAKSLDIKLSEGKEKHKRAIKQCKARINEIDDLYAQLYEDLSKGLIPERRFKMMTDRLDKEQEELLEKIEQYESEKNSGKEQLANIQDFIDEVSEYAGITELNFKMLHQLIDKILIFSAEEIDGEKVQKIQIHYKFIGALGMIE